MLGTKSKEMFNYINPLNPTGSHVDQFMGVSETCADQNVFCQERLTYSTGLHADHRVNGVV